MHKISVTHMNNAHGDWLRAIDFYKQELDILKARLTEIASKNSHPDVLQQVEHFENQFTIQRENMDKLAHEIHTNLASTSREVQESGAGYIDDTLLAQHHRLQERFTAEEKVIHELRHDFNRFAAEWM
jgi:hypothetical protein